MENELFGHDADAFTGATSTTRGLIHDADGGTLFPDEIDSLPLPTQVKLLRFLQDKTYRPLGARKMCQADSGIVEQFLNVAITTDAGSRRLDRVLADESNLVRMQLKNAGTPDSPNARPGDSAAAENPADPAADPTKFKKFAGGLNSAALSAKADLFNLLCIPADSRGSDTPKEVYQEAMIYCTKRRAMLIVDPPAAWGVNKETAAAKAVAGLSALGLTDVEARNAALYFPRVIQSDPQLNGQLDTFVPCGIVAGVMARTDTQRGVWKAPAGLDASLNGTQGLQANLNDAENGMLNPLAINCLRFFPASVAAAQSTTSLIPPLGNDKSKVLTLHLRNRMIFRSADEADAVQAADFLGKKQVGKRSWGSSAGKRSVNYSETEEHKIKTYKLRKLRDHECVLIHCERGFRRVTLPPLAADGGIAQWFSWWKRLV